jgi:hypothetical protein
MTTDQINDLARQIAEQLVAEGRLIEAGFTIFRGMELRAMNDVTIEVARLSFFAGAQHLFGTLMTIMDADAEPTPGDLKKMDSIHRELQRWTVDYEQQRANRETRQ